MQTEIILRGYAVGPIWWPAGAECYLPLNHSVTAYDRRVVNGARRGKCSLREHVDAALTEHGRDFQHCSLADGYLEVTRTSRHGATVTRRTRLFPLDMFPSVADMRCDNWEGPAE